MNSDVIEVDFSQSIAEMMQQNIITKLLNLQLQFKIFHWQTFSLSKHLAFGELYDGLSENIDEFVETYQGIYGRIDFTNQSCYLANLKDESFKMILAENIDSLKKWDTLFQDTDLLNQRDEILAILNKTSYLLTLE